jgi:hypothetical protein
MVIADNVPVGIRSEADLQELEILLGENELPLLYATGAEEKVILRKCSKAGAVARSRIWCHLGNGRLNFRGSARIRCLPVQRPPKKFPPRLHEVLVIGALAPRIRV